MRIAICSQDYLPTVGGVPTISRCYAKAFHKMGHSPFIITGTLQSDSGLESSDGFPVYRLSHFLAIARRLSMADAIVFNHLSVRYILAWLFSRKPVVSILQAPLPAGHDWRNRLSRFIFQSFIRSTGRLLLISEYVRPKNGGPFPIIGNPYDDSLFFDNPSPRKAGSLIFSGRVNRGKGIFVLLEAVEILCQQGVNISLTVVGDGPDLVEAQRLSKEKNLPVHWRGAANPSDVAEELRQHDIAIIPSIFGEPFGVVAVEAIASGCYVIAFEDGGLPEAIGEAGLLIKPKTSAALANGIQELMISTSLRSMIREKRELHLNDYQADCMAKKVMKSLEP